jgi:hypothetical protein
MTLSKKRPTGILILSKSQRNYVTGVRPLLVDDILRLNEASAITSQQACTPGKAAIPLIDSFAMRS